MSYAGEMEKIEKVVPRDELIRRVKAIKAEMAAEIEAALAPIAREIEQIGHEIFVVNPEPGPARLSAADRNYSRLRDLAGEASWLQEAIGLLQKVPARSWIASMRRENFGSLENQMLDRLIVEIEQDRIAA